MFHDAVFLARCAACGVALALIAALTRDAPGRHVRALPNAMQAFRKTAISRFRSSGDRRNARQEKVSDLRRNVKSVCWRQHDDFRIVVGVFYSGPAPARAPLDQGSKSEIHASRPPTRRSRSIRKLEAKGSVVVTRKT